MNMSGVVVDLRRRVHPGLEIDARFQVGPERLVIFGPSGSGKSTLLRMIAGLERLHEGSIHLEGECLDDSSKRIHLPARRRKIGTIFQDDRLFPHLNVALNIGFGLRKSRTERLRRIGFVSELCGTSHLLDRFPDSLSGGERQRVGLARAIAPRPRLLLCDEPVSALDLPTRFQLLENLRAIQERESIPLIYVTHAPAEAEMLGTRMIEWSDGRGTRSGTPRELLAARRGEFAAENCWAGVLVASEGGRGTVRIRPGVDLIVSACPIAVGESVDVRLDADRVVLVAPSAPAVAENRLRVVVDSVEHGSDESRVDLRFENERLSISLTSSSARAVLPGTSWDALIDARSFRVEHKPEREAADDHES
jgi:molybdate transport system ATP-binding protein